MTTPPDTPPPAAPSWGPVGRLLRDHLAGRRGARARWTLEDGERLWLPASVFFREEAEMPPAEVLALDLCRGHVLDGGAGAGAHALALQERGLEVTALDACPEAVETMRGRGVTRPVLGDLFAWNGPPADTLLLMMNGIGFVGDLAGLDRFLDHAHRLVAEDGQILLDSSDLADSDNPREPARIRMRLAAGRYRGEARVTIAYRGLSAATRWLFVDRRTLARRARDRGWRCQVVYQGDEGDFLARLTRSAAAQPDGSGPRD